VEGPVTEREVDAVPTVCVIAADALFTKLPSPL
jgi:hypothetical protein